MEVDNWLLKNLFKVPHLREYMEEKQWKQQMKTKRIVCVYFLYLFWLKNVPDSVCVCVQLIDFGNVIICIDIYILSNLHGMFSREPWDNGAAWFLERHCA